VACIVDFGEGRRVVDGEAELDSSTKAHATAGALAIGPSTGTYIDSTSLVLWASWSMIHWE